jgi:Tol biopolymer transport system component
VDPVWSPDSRSILFSSLRDSTRALWRIAVAGDEPVRLTVGSGPESQPSLSRDRRKLAYSTFADALDLAIVEPATGRRHPIATELDESAPDLAPDGSALVYVTGQSGAGSALWLQALSSGDPSGPPRRIAEHSGSINTPELSPDGDWVAFKRESAGRREIWIVSANGGPAERFSEPGVESVHPAWSPSGDRLAYAAQVSGTYRLRVAEVRGGRRYGASIQIPAGGAGSNLLPAWSREGKRIAFLSGEDEIWISPAAERDPDPPLRVGHIAGAGRLRWASDGETIWVAAGRPGSDPRIHRLASGPAAGGSDARPLVDSLPGGAPPGEFDFTADGRWLVYTTQRSRGDIWLVESRTALF